MDRQSQIEIILDRYENPKFKGVIDDADVDVEGTHPGCADIVHVYLKIENDMLVEISFSGDGCTVSQASADMLAEMIEGKALEFIEDIDHQVIADLLGEEIVQNRTKCALLPLDTIKRAIEKYRDQSL